MMRLDPSRLMVPSVRKLRKGKDGEVLPNLHFEAVAKAQREMRAKALRPANRISAASDPSAAWVVLRVMTGRETAVDKLLSDADVETFLPVREGRKTYRKGKPISVSSRPVLPGYLLARISVMPDAVLALTNVEHVIGMLGGLLYPFVVSDSSIERFRSILEAPEPAEKVEQDWVSEGAYCRVVAGPIAGFNGYLVPFHKHPNGHVKMRKGPNVKVAISLTGHVTEIEMPLAFVIQL